MYCFRKSAAGKTVHSDIKRMRETKSRKRGASSWAYLIPGGVALGSPAPSRAVKRVHDKVAEEVSFAVVCGEVHV